MLQLSTLFFFFFFNDTATTEIYTLSLHDALPICGGDPKKNVTGGRLSEMLHVLGEAVDEETPASANDIPRPGWVGRIVFRQMAAVYCRKDHGMEKGTAQRRPVGRILAAMSFARGGGRIPRVNALIPGTTFAQAQAPAELLSPTG